MHFNAAPLNAGSVQAVASQGLSHHAADTSTGRWTLDGRDDNSTEWRLRPGELQSVRQLQQRKQQPQAPLLLPLQANQSPAKKSLKDVTALVPSRKPPLSTTMAPEPINYLKLRRTKQSRRAVLRNRSAIASVVAQEVLTPSIVPTLKSPAPRASCPELHVPSFSPPKLSVMALEAPPQLQPQHSVDAATMASSTKALAQQQQVVQLEAQKAAKQVTALLAGLRASSGASLYKCTPLFKLYARRRLRSRWGVWRDYVAWHAQEQQRLELLAPFAVHIQRVFRFRRCIWSCRRARLDELQAQWEASHTLQSCARRWLRERVRVRELTVAHAIRLQASWRGRSVRKQVKRELQTQLRALLASLTPTGELHRLHDVARGDRKLAAKVNAMLVLVAETHVSVELSRGQQHTPKFAAIAARNTARPVEATRRQLFHAVHELRALVATRDLELQATKQRFLEDQRRRRKQQREARALILKQELACSTQRLSEAREREDMHRADLETQEEVRMQRTMAEDLILRRERRCRRREQEENALMLVEEYQMRYVVAETQRREMAARDRLREVSKREAFLQAREQQQLHDLEAVIRLDAEKKAEMALSRATADEQEKAQWLMLSKTAKAEALERLEQREREEEESRRRMEDLVDAEQAAERERKRLKEALRRQKHLELDRERRERGAMAEADRSSRQWHFACKKLVTAVAWEAKRERERTKYSLDPLEYAKVEAQKVLEEKQRREACSMRHEDALSRAVEEKTRMERHFQLCREKKRLREIEQRREAQEVVFMAIEDENELEHRHSEKKSEEYQRQLREMQQLADHVVLKQKERVQEARQRKLMHDEESWQRRCEHGQLLLDRAREKRERQTMQEEDRSMRTQTMLESRRQDKRQREKRNIRMMREDVESMERQDWEDEGARLEKLLWTPREVAALRLLVTDYPQFLILNVQVFMELADEVLAGSSPPFELDYDSVASHLETEHTLSEEDVPPKKRKLRRFFYHEFFEEDPILARIRRRSSHPNAPETPPPPTTGPGSTNTQTRERWKRVATHFLGRSWGSDASRKGFLLMQNRQYDAACSCLLEAVHGMQKPNADDGASIYQDVPPALLRQLGRCYLKRFEACAQRELLHKSLFFFQQASTHIVLVSSPSFLQEIAFALELSGDLRHAAEILGGIISCFPRYSRLMEVIFRAALVMFSLKMYRQSREYLLHTMDAAPFGWEPFDIMFLAARIMQLEGKLSRKLCAVAYEDAFRKNLKGRLHRVHSTWQDWIKSPDTWREVGDRYFERREYALARDAYHVMLKRQTHKPSQLASKRQAVVAAIRRQQTSLKEDDTALDGTDWLRLSSTFAMLNDQSMTIAALSRWFAASDGGYRERVLERFHRWPLVRWKLLTGVKAPLKITQWFEDQRRVRAEAEAQAREERERKRLEILRQRSERSHLALQAWGQTNETLLQNEHQSHQIQEQSDETTAKGTVTSMEQAAGLSPAVDEGVAAFATGTVSSARVATDGGTTEAVHEDTS